MKSQQLSDFIQNPKRFVEIGVLEGAMSRNLLSRYPEIEEYWGIDPYKPYSKGGAPLINARFKTEEDWNELYIRVCLKMSRYPNFTLLRVTSEEASKFFPDAYFDHVFIDGNHTYEHVKIDIESWLPKVKPGGAISGHDYGAPMFPGVKKAVHELISKPVIILKERVWVYPVN